MTSTTPQLPFSLNLRSEVSNRRLVMEQLTAPRRRRRRKACTECQRRKQKCVPRKHDEQCAQCHKRFPPVECIFPPWSQASNTDPSGRPVVFLSGTSVFSSRERRRLPSEDSSDPRNEETYRAEIDSLVQRFKERLTVASHSGWLSESLALEAPEGYLGLKPLGGMMTAIGSCVNSAWLPNNTRSVELLGFYLRFIIPNMISINGETAPRPYLQSVVPWMLQSPVYPAIGLLISSAVQAGIVGGGEKALQEVATLKARVFFLMHKYIENRSPREWAEELMGCTLNLLVFEWLWGTEETLRVHLKGARDILQLHGGYGNLASVVKDPVKTAPLILTDYVVACCSESDLYMLADDPARGIFADIPGFSPDNSQSPLVPVDITFREVAGDMRISYATAKLLDDIRFLTLCVTSTSRGERKQKIQGTASWLHQQLTSAQALAAAPRDDPLEESSIIHKAVRSAAVLYTWALSSIQPMSEFSDDAVRHDILESLHSVSLKRWEQIPGIYLWVVLVAASGTSADFLGRSLRRKVSVATASIGFSNFPLAISCVRSFWLVQRWIQSMRA